MYRYSKRGFAYCTKRMKNFTKVPNELLKLSEDGKIDCYDIAVYFAIFMHRNEKTGLCCPGNRRLIKMLNISQERLTKSIKELKKCFVLEGTYKRGAPSHYKSASFERSECTATQGITILNNNTNNKDLNIDYNKNKIELDKIRKKLKNRNIIK